MILSLSLNYLFSFSAISKLSAIDFFHCSTCTLLLQSHWEHLHQRVDLEHKSTFVPDLLITSCSSALGCTMEQPQTGWTGFLGMGMKEKLCSRGASRSSGKGEFNNNPLSTCWLQLIQNKGKPWNVDFRSSLPRALLYKSSPVCTDVVV